jgi:hypothetical protein
MLFCISNLMCKVIRLILKIVGLSVGKEVARALQTLRLGLPNIQGDYSFALQVKNCLRRYTYT